MKKKIVIIGAGPAGILTAKKLAKKTKGLDVDITIIDKNPFHTMLTELHEVAAWRVDESSIRIDLKKIFAGRPVNVVQDNIISSDYEKQIITGENATYSYDYLVVATGCKPTYWGVEGAKEHSFPLWSYDDAIRLRAHIYDMFQQASRTTDINKKKELLTFYIVGAGFTGVEMAGELAEFVPIVCKKFYIDPSLVSMHIVDVLDKLMPYLPDKLQQRSLKRLEKTGVQVSLSTGVLSVNENSITIEKNEKRIIDTTRTVIWAAGTEGSDFVMNASELGLKEKSRGRVELDRQLRTHTFPNVYVAGDNMHYIPEGEEETVPQMMENAEYCAPIIAKNITSALKGEAQVAEYKPTFHGMMVCIGGKYGTAHVGMPKMMFKLPSFFAMFAKHFINMFFFIQVAGWSKVFSYLRTEFFTIRDGRSFVGGHFSNRSASFMMVPLRLFMGIWFVYYAYVMLESNWLTQYGILRNRFYDVAAEFRPAIEYFYLGEWFRFDMYSAGGHMGMWIRTTPVNWFYQTLVFSSTGAELFWQIMTVLFFAGVGLALMGGLFTTLAALAAIAASGVILVTTGLPFYLWWLPFAGVAMLFSGGKVLSLDYWVMPWLSKQWKKIPFVKKWYIYHD